MIDSSYNDGGKWSKFNMNDYVLIKNHNSYGYVVSFNDPWIRVKEEDTDDIDGWRVESLVLLSSAPTPSKDIEKDFDDLMDSL